MSNYITRDKVISKAAHDMICEMYRRAQPSVDFDMYLECFKQGILDPDKCPIHNWHYLPMKVQVQIVEDYLKAYGASDQFKKWAEFLLDNFKNGGHRTVYKDIFNTGEKVRTGEETEKLPELIGDENAEKVYKLIEDYLGFYRTNMDEHSIRGAIMECPTSNPEEVIKKWGPELKIDDSVYMGYDDRNFDYTYKDYIDGACTGEDYLWELEEQDCCCCCEEEEDNEENTEEV